MSRLSAVYDLSVLFKRLKKKCFTFFRHTQFESSSSVNSDLLNRLLKACDFLNKQFSVSVHGVQ